MTILVTGAAGFIGFHVAHALLARGDIVVGIDSINDYYDPALKRARLDLLKRHPAFRFYQYDLCDYDRVSSLFQIFPIERICHFAAQAGVRYSLSHPFVYQKSNNEGFLNIIEMARLNRIHNFVYASSSSVYGGNTKLPFCEEDRCDNPISLYAATKRANELVANCYSHLFGLPCSGLRLFTVYGPWGRPDMALFVFTRAILEGKPIDVYNNGNMRRNFTYIDDVVNGVLLTLDTVAHCQLYNIGNNRAESLMDFIAAIEAALGKRAIKNFLPMQPGDVPETVADITKIQRLGFEPCTNIQDGISRFVAWYLSHYKT